MSDFDEQDDIFLETSDDTRSSAYFSARCSTSEQLSASWGPEDELWTSELLSVNERRHRFLVRMGFAKPIPTGITFSQWQGEILADRAFRDLEDRINSICSSYRPSFSHGASAPDSTRNSVVLELDEIEHHELTGILDEKGSGRSPARGMEIEFSEKQNDPKSFCGRFKRKEEEDIICMHDTRMKSLKSGTLFATKVDQQNKKWMDFSALYMCQEIHAHGGSISVMKFSTSGRYLASVGEDCVVRIWRIHEVESSPDLYIRETPVKSMDRNMGLKMKVGKGRGRALAIIPRKVFNIAETPLHEFHGHTSDILDMTWSKSNFLLTSSKDKTVRMWKVGCDDCLAVFKHRDYERRVVDWADAKDIITAVGYQPDGQGLIVGIAAGRCRFYNHAGENVELEKVLKVTKKKSAGRQITSLQFSCGDPARILIASAGSKIRVSDGGAKINRKFEGRRGSKVLVPPSLTSDGQYLVSAGADSNVYIWDLDRPARGKSRTRGPRRVRSCEHFFSEGVTSVATWPGLAHQQEDLQSPEKGAAPTLCRDRELCSFGTWFSADGARGAATWPEEKLLPSLRYVNCAGMDDCRAKVSAAWNKVVVTGGSDGVIRCFHNYGLPVKL
ncbi:uncharacterized protein [Zea mays]|uniref:Transducin/WD40 repeat-like superfamily protein n=1 Tax=Zea mays TaxID=4577 RepID=A0A1D6HA54_MAIZE|nr:uncharacterized protein LOC103627260 isoform X4 [Zea mays]AQK71588.1 Transducin/WD40 repeat-like superfamily protein [Zea mays]|eukprot:XP_020394146.1 uncharacterized protein LOC103627260 isoform X4 [Zea mays]